MTPVAGKCLTSTLNRREMSEWHAGCKMVSCVAEPEGQSIGGIPHSLGGLR